MASVLITNITRDLVFNQELNIIIASENNNSSFKVNEPLYLRASAGAKPHEKVFNEMAFNIPDLNQDENGDVYAVIEKVSKFQVSVYNIEEKKYDIFIEDLYLNTKEMKSLMDEQGMTEDEFLSKYGKHSIFNGYLIKFNL